MIRSIQEKIEGSIRQLLWQLFQLKDYQIPEAQYPEMQMGDLSYTLAFPLAKVLKKNPKAIAQQIADAFPISSVPEIQQIQIGGNGYLNFRLNRTTIARKLFDTPLSPELYREGKAIVEHTNINPNKAAHVGHLRNACLGDTLVRLLRFNGTPVEVQNYIDDTGVQLADIVVGFQRKGLREADLDRIPGKLDHYFWDLYSETHSWLEEAKENKVYRERMLKAMEDRIEPEFSLSQVIANRIIRCHLQTMRRLGIDYDLLPRESDIIGMKFWQHTFELLKEKGAIVQVKEGKNKDCWVMTLSSTQDFEDMQNPDKIIVRSNGTVTYVGKDISYQLWKFGLLGVDFHYRVFERRPDGSILWTTTSGAGEIPAPHFGGAELVYNVIDQRQSYLQKVVGEGLRALGYQEQAEKSIHFSYEVVTLSPKTAQDLGFKLSQEDQEKAFIEMSGRKGLGVKADDLIDRLEQEALKRIRPLYSDLDERDLIRLASDIAAGALRYFMVRYARNTVITFDMEEALSFEGETGPYLQYSLVRARSIFRKLKASGQDISLNSHEEYLEALQSLAETNQESDDSWAIIVSVIKTKDWIERTLRSLEISLFAKQVFYLAQMFNNYYHKYSVLHEPDAKKKLFRTAVVKMFQEGMQTCLELLGIPVPERM
jgi:arginyl-tRNA synthetase